MKKSFLGLLFAVLFILCSVVCVYALGADDFNTAVAGINKNASYAERLSTVENAQNLYASLTDEEKAEASSSYAILQAEVGELEALAERLKDAVFGKTIL